MVSIMIREMFDSEVTLHLKAFHYSYSQKTSSRPLFLTCPNSLLMSPLKIKRITRTNQTAACSPTTWGIVAAFSSSVAVLHNLSLTFPSSQWVTLLESHNKSINHEWGSWSHFRSWPSRTWGKKRSGSMRNSQWGRHCWRRDYGWGFMADQFALVGKSHWSDNRWSYSHSLSDPLEEDAALLAQRSSSSLCRHSSGPVRGMADLRIESSVWSSVKVLTSKTYSMFCVWHRRNILSLPMVLNLNNPYLILICPDISHCVGGSGLSATKSFQVFVSVTTSVCIDLIWIVNYMRIH